MVPRKHRLYAPYALDLQRTGVDYKPLVWSAYGRPHEDASAFVRLLARRQARRWGAHDWRSLCRRMETRIAVILWRRAARMVRRCWPRRHDLEEDEVTAPRGGQAADPLTLDGAAASQ